MLSYKLCEKLKDVGYSPEWCLGRFFYEEEGLIGFVGEVEILRHIEKYPDNEVPIPVLSELVEACGGKFHDLHNYKDGWVAESAEEEGKGDTPEEAVAHLILKLHGDMMLSCKEKNTGTGKEVVS